MKTTCVLVLAIMFGTVVAPAQDCKPEDSASLSRLKDAVRRVTATHVYTGWDDKAFSRSGDMAAVAVVKTIPESQMSKPETVKEVLWILRTAFACPSRCVEVDSDRQPGVTMLLLQHLHDSTSGPTQSQVDEARSFILQQTREVAP
jgi:hypothetical protein